ncbi:hypothetical protein [Clostridium sp.]|uniref:hypothetical protein n=1 Tax=Clostridium sp. TaxID=1506 RepID=UPI00292ED4B5|nr:hypothetical protein [Clostridium sp.]
MKFRWDFWILIVQFEEIDNASDTINTVILDTSATTEEVSAIAVEVNTSVNVLADKATEGSYRGSC